MMKPFVKWAGGKKQILDLVLKKIDECVSLVKNKNDFTFIEPFVGGGVVFLNLKNPHTIINDLNKELMTTYRIIRNHPQELMNELDVMYLNFRDRGTDYYLEVREEDRLPDYPYYDEIDIASRLIFLNKTCFNGLYRVNSEGYFNTPIGRNNITGLYNRKDIEKISNFLNRIPEDNIMNGSYKNAMNRSRFWDVIYVDPPYDYTENDGFTKYQKEGFSLEDLKELRQCCDEALDRESFVIVSNNDTKAVREAFKNDNKHNYSFYYIESINTKRTINCKGNKRDTGKEIIIVGIPCLFPQTKDVAKLIEYIRVKNANDIQNIDALVTRFKVTKARVRQVLSTLQYFDIINNENGFTDAGLLLRKCPRGDINRMMRDVILNKNFFAQVFCHDSVDTSKKWSVPEVTDIVINNVPGIGNNIATNRARIIREIVDWCLAN